MKYLRATAAMAAVGTMVAAPMTATDAWATGAVNTQPYVIGPTVAGAVTSSGTSVSGATLQVSQSGAAATGAQYIIGFRATTALTGSGNITITAPPGTDLSGAEVKFIDASSGVSSVLGLASVRTSPQGGSAVPNQVVLAVPGTVAAGDQVYIELNGVTNPVAGLYGGSSGDFTVSTTSDASPVDIPSYQVTASPSASQASIELSSAVPGAAATYLFGDLQATAALSTLQLQAPAGTVFPSGTSYYSVTDETTEATALVPASVTGGGTSDVTIMLPAGVGQGDYVAVDVSDVRNPATAGTYTTSVTGAVQAAVKPVPTVTVTTTTQPGYWLATQSGYVYPEGSAQAFGGMTVTSATGNVVGMAAAPDGQGYWLVTANGTVDAFGDATSYGDLPADHVSASDIVSMAPTADGKGYWLVGRDGGMFAFGDATFHGSIPALKVHVSDIVGMVSSADGKGYLVVGSDGGVFSFGTAHFNGSLPGLGVHVDDVRAILRTSTGNGYVLVGSDGGAFVFGSGARFAGSLPGRGITVDNIVGIALTGDGAGYYMAGSGGSVYTFGDAGSFSMPSGLTDHLPVVAIAAV